MDSDAFLAANSPSANSLAARAAGIPGVPGVPGVNGKVAYAVLDTWEGEPAFRTDVLAKADIATPHIAGHSFEGKVMGTVMVYHAVCRFLGIEPTWTPEGRLPPPLVPEIKLDPTGLSEEAALWRIVRPVYDIEADDRRLRAGTAADPKTRGKHFEQLRANYPIRPGIPVHACGAFSRAFPGWNPKSAIWASLSDHNTRCVTFRRAKSALG